MTAPRTHHEALADAAQMVRERPADAIPFLERLIAESAESPALEGRARLALAGALNSLAVVERALEEAERAADLLAANDDPAGHAQAMSAIGRARLTMGDSDGAVAAFEEGVQLARQAKDVRVEATLQFNLAAVFGVELLPAAYYEHTERALELWERTGDPHPVAMCHVNLAGGALGLGDATAAARHLDAARATIDALGPPYWRAVIRACDGALAFLQGDPDGGAAAYAESNEQLRKLGMSQQLARHQHLCARYLNDSGRPGAAVRLIAEGLALADDGQFAQVRAALYEELSRAREQLGDPAGALAALRERARLHDAARMSTIEARLRLQRQLRAVRDARHDAERERERSEELDRANSELLDMLRQQDALRSELERLATIDPLTSLLNRRAFLERARAEIARMRRYRRPVSAVVIDADHFKRVNDRYGHLVGDEVLMGIARRVTAALRLSDVVARYGGEEMCALLPETDAAEAALVAERIRAAVGTDAVRTASGLLRVTVSVGVATMRPSDNAIDDLLRRADDALYAAKRSGRDRVCTEADAERTDDARARLRGA